ncbi:hypothetical protein LUX05_21545 [Streptomyces somaliensis]|nr:hypothetical protein [Streptomyces somaliensis]
MQATRAPAEAARAAAPYPPAEGSRKKPAQRVGGHRPAVAGKAHRRRALPGRRNSVTAVPMTGAAVMTTTAVADGPTAYGLQGQRSAVRW